MQAPLGSAGGWAETWASRIDSDDRGFFGDLYRAPPERRQVIFAVLAALELAPERTWEFAQLGAQLRQCKGSQLIAEHYGSDPAGYRNALAKLGLGAGGPALYARLHSEFATPANPRRLQLLRHLGATCQEQLDLLDGLDPVARLPNILALVSQPCDVHRLNVLLAAIRRHCSAATDTILHRSLRRIAGHKQLSAWFERTLGRADRFPPPPWPGTANLQPLASAEAMHACAAEFRNCLRNRVLAVLDGEAFYYLWRGPGEPAVLSFGPAFPRVVGEVEILGRRNRRVSAETLQAIAADLQASGYEIRRSISNHVLDLWERASLDDRSDESL